MLMECSAQRILYLAAHKTTYAGMAGIFVVWQIGNDRVDS